MQNVPTKQNVPTVLREKKTKTTKNIIERPRLQWRIQAGAQQARASSKFGSTKFVFYSLFD